MATRDGAAAAVNLQLLLDIEETLRGGEVVELGDSGYSFAIRDEALVMKYPAEVSPTAGFRMSALGPASKIATLIAPYLQSLDDEQRATLAANLALSQFKREDPGHGRRSRMH